MKKLICLLLSLSLLTVSGCGTGNQEPAEPISETQNTQAWDMSEPPRLTVSCGDVSFVLHYAGCVWEGPSIEGQSFAKIADAVSPLDVRNPPKQFSVGNGELELTFDMQPSSVVIRMWDEQRMGNSLSEPLQTLEDVYSFYPEGTARIYEVTATWEGGEYHGEARYHFRLITGVMPIE